jgi:hypothetical protein
MMVAQVLRSSPSPSPLSEWMISPTFPLAEEGRLAAQASGEDRARTREAFARVQLLRELLLALATDERESLQYVRAAGIGSAVARALAAQLEGRPTEIPDAAVVITVAPGGGQQGAAVRMELQSRDLARALSGWTVRRPLETSPEPRLQWQATFGDSVAIVAIEPLPGSDTTLPRDILFAREGVLLPARLVSPDGALFNHIASLDGSSAVATGFGVSSSVRVDEKGRVTIEPAWPRPIDAEIPFGDGRLAWTGTLVPPVSSESVLQWRDGSGHIASATVPFMSLNAVVASQGRVYWPAVTGGLWRWSPEEGAEQVIGGQPLVNAVREDAGVRLEAIDPSKGRVRPGQQHSLRLHEGGRLEPGATNPLGVLWSRAEAGGAPQKPTRMPIV